MKRQYEIYCIMLPSVWLNILMNDFIVFCTLRPFKFKAMLKNEKKKKKSNLVNVITCPWVVEVNHHKDHPYWERWDHS